MITPGGMTTGGMTPVGLMPSPASFGAPLSRHHESHARVTAPWDGRLDGRLQSSGGLGGGGPGEHRLGAIPEGDHSDEIRLKATLSEPRYAEPVVRDANPNPIPNPDPNPNPNTKPNLNPEQVRGATREAELSRMLEWEPNPNPNPNPLTLTLTP